MLDWGTFANWVLKFNCAPSWLTAMPKWNESLAEVRKGPKFLTYAHKRGLPGATVKDIVQKTFDHGLKPDTSSNTILANSHPG